MREALKQAKLALEKGDVPVGAVVVHKGQIIGRGYNQMVLLKDPTAHAEMIAITQAANTLGSKWLHKCCLYVTIEPCSMCAGALVLSRIPRICIGALDPKAGACGSVSNIVQHPQLNHRIEVKHGVCADICAGMVTDFFQKKRKPDEIGKNNP